MFSVNIIFLLHAYINKDPSLYLPSYPTRGFGFSSAFSSVLEGERGGGGIMLQCFVPTSP